jgi:CHAD domain-containing protein
MLSQSPLRYGPFRKRLDAFAREVPHIERGHVDALHRARVASRRLRELLPLLELDRDTTRKLNRRLKAVTAQLGTVRELDVLFLLMEEFEQDGRCSPAALRHVRAAVAHARAAARERLASTLPTAKLGRLADKLERVATQVEAGDVTSRRTGASGPPRAWVWALDARLARRAARVRTAIGVAGALYSPERLHNVRIALKKLRYATELSKEVGRRRMTACITTLKAGQDLLGRLHDLEVLLQWGREVQATLSPPDLTAWEELGSLVHAVEDECRQWHARYMRERTRLIALADHLGPRTPHAAGADLRVAG